MKETVRAYAHILKPGITVSNTISAVAGYFLGVSVAEVFSGSTLIGLVVGIAAVIASACVANNVLDEKIDARMKRTSRREVVTGRIGRSAALVYSAALGVIGFATLLVLTNVLTVLLGVAALGSWLPARRASSVDPAVTLRAD